VSQDVNGSHDEPSALAYVHVIAMVELLKRYSHSPELLYDLRTTWRVVTEKDSGPDEPDTTERPRLRRITDRLSPDDIQSVIELHQAGISKKKLASRFGISPKSVQRLLREHRERGGKQLDESA